MPWNTNTAVKWNKLLHTTWMNSQGIMLNEKKANSKRLHTVWSIYIKCLKWQNYEMKEIIGCQESTLVQGRKVKVLVTQLCPALCDPMDCSQPGSSVHGILQARVLEWVAIPSPRIFLTREWTCVSCIEGKFFTIWAIREALVQGKGGLKRTTEEIFVVIEMFCFFTMSMSISLW